MNSELECAHSYRSVEHCQVLSKDSEYEWLFNFRSVTGYLILIIRDIYIAITSKWILLDWYMHSNYQKYLEIEHIFNWKRERQPLKVFHFGFYNSYNSL